MIILYKQGSRLHANIFGKQESVRSFRDTVVSMETVNELLYARNNVRLLTARLHTSSIIEPCIPLSIFRCADRIAKLQYYVAGCYCSARKLFLPP